MNPWMMAFSALLPIFGFVVGVTMARGEWPWQWRKR